MFSVFLFVLIFQLFCLVFVVFWVSQFFVVVPFLFFLFSGFLVSGCVDSPVVLGTIEMQSVLVF